MINISFTIPPVFAGEEPQFVSVDCPTKEDATATVDLAFATLEVFEDAMRVLNNNEERK